LAVTREPAAFAAKGDLVGVKRDGRDCVWYVFLSFFSRLFCFVLSFTLLYAQYMPYFFLIKFFFLSSLLQGGTRCCMTQRTSTAGTNTAAPGASEGEAPPRNAVQLEDTVPLQATSARYSVLPLPWARLRLSELAVRAVWARDGRSADLAPGSGQDRRRVQ
jgi:hypothetical protein